MLNIRYLILVLTTRCNLECLYCYNGDVTDDMDMSQTVMDRSFDLVSSTDRQFHLQLTGGEPTLVPHLIKEAILKARSINETCFIGIQTNATCLNPELVSLFKEFRVQVGVSLDGPPTVHEALRGEVAKTLRGLELLEDMELPFRVTTVVSNGNVRYLNRLVLMLSRFSQVRGIGLDFLVNKGRARDSYAFVNAADVEDIQKGVEDMLVALKEINRRRSYPLEFRELEMVKKQSRLMKNRTLFCHACNSSSIAVHPDGTLFPCGQTLGDSHFRAGTVWKPEFEKLKMLETAKIPPPKSVSLYSCHAMTGTPKHETCRDARSCVSTISSDFHINDSFLGECDECPLMGRCPGECPSRLYYNRGAKQILTCTLYRKLFESLSSSESVIVGSG